MVDGRPSFVFQQMILRGLAYQNYSHNCRAIQTQRPRSNKMDGTLGKQAGRSSS